MVQPLKDDKLRREKAARKVAMDALVDALIELAEAQVRIRVLEAALDDANFKIRTLALLHPGNRGGL